MLAAAQEAEAFFDPNQQRHQKLPLKLKMSVISAQRRETGVLVQRLLGEKSI
jgi:hypothetical protein